jgi:hypothetical protein
MLKQHTPASRDRTATSLLLPTTPRNALRRWPPANLGGHPEQLKIA